jgi:hypothetical protein
MPVQAARTHPDHAVPRQAADGERSPLISLEKFTGEVGQSVLPRGGRRPSAADRGPDYWAQ